MQMQLDLNYVSHPALSQNAYLVGLAQCLFAISFFRIYGPEDAWDRFSSDIQIFYLTLSFRLVTTAYQRVKAQTMKSKIL